MSKLNVFTLALLLLCSSFSAFASEPADSQIKGALGDITRFESQFPEATSPRKSAVYRALKLLQLTRERLDSSKNQTHQSWKLANQRLTTLVNRLQATIKKNDTAETSSQTPLTGRDKSRPVTDSSRAKTPSKQKALISQDLVRIKKLGRDIASATQSLDQGGPKPFQDPAYVKKFDSASARFHQSLQKYSAFAENSGVQQATSQLEKLDGMILFGKEQANIALQELGNVQTTLTSLQAKIRDKRPPEAPRLPYTSKGISDWIEQAKHLRRQAVADYRHLEMIQAKAWLPLTRGTVEQGAAFDMQDVSRLLSGLQRNVQTIDETLKQLEANLNVQVTAVGRTLEWFNKLDPADSHARKNSFLGQGNEAEALQTLEKESQVAKAAVMFDKQLNRDTLAQRQMLVHKIEQAKTHYLAQRAQALKLARMPKPESTNTTLLQIARDTLAKPDYAVGDILRLVINSDKVQREKETSEVEIDEVDVSLSGDVKLSGTKTMTRYQWEQFQVATAEPVGDTFFIFYNTLKYFTAGATTTPLNRWLLSARIQGSEIPRQNIDLQ